MSGLELVKTLAPEDSQIDDLAPESAVEIIRSQEAKLKVAAKKRIAKPKSGEDVIYDFVSRKTNKVSIAQFATGFSTMIIGGAAAGSLELLGLGTLVAALCPVTYIVGTAVLGKAESMQKLFPSLKRKIQENEAERRLWEMKEKEYRKVEKKVLRKAEPAVKYLNSQMPTHEVVLSSKFGKEKFKLKRKKLDNMDKILTKVVPADDSVTQNKELMSNVSRKEITGG